jgi:hypothetical protein
MPGPTIKERMKIEISVRRIHLACFIIALAVLAGINYVIAQTSYTTLGHSASQIGPGTFQSGDYTFPGDVVVSSGKVGIGTAGPSAKLDIRGGTDVDLSNSAKPGYIVLGGTSGENIGIDNNEIMARDGWDTSTLYIQHQGGSASFGGDVKIADGSNLCLGSDCESSWPSLDCKTVSCHNEGPDWRQCTASCDGGYILTGCSIHYNAGSSGTWGIKCVPDGNGCSCASGMKSGFVECYARCCRLLY